jgi:hypothetical protein
MIKASIAISFLFVLLAGCGDDDDSVAAQLLGGGPGGSDPSASPGQTVNGGIPSGYTPGQPIQTMASEFGAVDDPNPATNPLGINGGGDPGNGGGVNGWATGAGGQNIGSVNSTGISLPAATEIAIYGSTQAAQNQPVQVTDLDTGNSVTTTIVDVGPGASRVAAGYGADLTYGTARALGAPVNGGANVQVIPLTAQSFK